MKPLIEAGETRGAGGASQPQSKPEILDEEEMRSWEETLAMMGPDCMGRAHEMLLAAFSELRLHRAAVVRLEAWASWLEGGSSGGVVGGVNRNIADHLRAQMRGPDPRPPGLATPTGRGRGASRVNDE